MQPEWQKHALYNFADNACATCIGVLGRGQNDTQAFGDWQILLLGWKKANFFPADLRDWSAAAMHQITHIRKYRPLEGSIALLLFDLWLELPDFWTGKGKHGQLKRALFKYRSHAIYRLQTPGIINLKGGRLRPFARIKNKLNNINMGCSICWGKESSQIIYEVIIHKSQGWCDQPSFNLYAESQQLWELTIVENI